MLRRCHSEGDLRGQRMDFRIGEKEQALRDQIRRFAKEEFI